MGNATPAALQGKHCVRAPNGDTYDGWWVNGKREGQGIYFYANGDRYEGDWKNDCKHGKGIYVHSTGEK